MKKLNLCETYLKYSDNPEQLTNLMMKIEILVDLKGIVTKWDIQRFEYSVKITDGKERITFNYYGFHNDFLNGDDYPNNLLYSILACCATDFYIPEEFKDFCFELGYDEDSRKAYKLHSEALVQSMKLKKIFSEYDIECLPR